MTPLLKLLRPSHWLKNSFVFLPLFFNGSIFNPRMLLCAGIVFAMFCMVSSAVYCINDVVDREADRAHPKKCRRPVASGAVSPATAVIIAAILTILTPLTAVLALPDAAQVIAIVAAYMLMNIAYSLWLKHMAIIDVMIIAIGFVLRVAAGGMACSISLSSWIVIMTFLVTLLIAMAKRRSDFMIQHAAGNTQRESVRDYTPLFMNVCIGMLATMSVFGYIMYSLSAAVMTAGSEYFYCTSVFVIAGILRYLMLVFGRDQGDEPVKILMHDRSIQTCIAGWVLLSALMIYCP